MGGSPTLSAAKVITDVTLDMADERVDAIGEIVVGAGDLAKIDLDVALVRQLGDELLHRVDRHNRILIALQDKTRRRAGGEKREIIDVGRRRHRRA